ncbi:MAG: hypothetical protein CMN05_11670 [Roseibacillus sp.]|jgi:HEAT repeat protein|nr:hypothetical protein [Roseibacillus sp.]MCP4729050.1 hypothetical protein [Roseibacillus sp.]MDP7308269.1 HEAT repeat domain-containing protein [Roseibacillus sp.]HJM62660.1 HEAT repeat domain-containing protein [Roseibacillus sp.]
MKVSIELLLVCLAVGQCPGAEKKMQSPFARQVAEQVTKLDSDSPRTRAGAAEGLGFLRAYEAEEPLISGLLDRSVLVRREAAMALAWCGSRKAIPPLLLALQDEDWVTRQSAHVALNNLSGMEFPLNALAPVEEREAQVNLWRHWWAGVPADRPPADVLKLLEDSKPPTSTWTITASSTYRGPARLLGDGLIGPDYWQTKNVPLPQWCTVDLGRVEQVANLVIHQYGPQFVMTDYEVATSLDNRSFNRVERRKGESPVKLTIDFPPHQARYIRITSFGSKNSTYPTTFFEIEVNGQPNAGNEIASAAAWRWERGLRALGALGGRGASKAVIECLNRAPAKPHGPMMQAGIRALGRLREEVGFQFLIQLLDDTQWARHAAEALGDFGDHRAVPALLAAYPRYAKKPDGRNPARVPQDDRMGFPSEDRMLETPYAIAYALCRLPLDAPRDLMALRRIVPQLMANLPGDHDTFMLYEPEVGHLLTRYLMKKSGLRQEACEHAMQRLGQVRRVAGSNETVDWPIFKDSRMASWLPAVCIEKEDLPRLLELLQHGEGWVRINAAKTLAWLGDQRAIDPIARLLSEAKAEADYGYNSTFKNEEYDDPAPRWREGLIRALGLLDAHGHTDLLVRILNDEQSVLEIRHAAAEALGDLGNEAALTALRKAATHHSFHSVRHISRDALRIHGVELPPGEKLKPEPSPPPGSTGNPDSEASTLDGVVFIKGSNNIPNTIGTVEQADRWRQTYVVTDSGPVYRPGRNLHVLRPARPDGEVVPLTSFDGGYVGDLELSWDASHAIFAHRGEDDPWWHLFRINLDGSGLEQLTEGPYHDVGPVYLPDGHIAFATTRSGIRDEYHGYPCTALWVMDADGGNMRPIATNIGRDNEPAILPDGRIVFSRLDVFYSRNKTELTLHAVRPDGTKDVVLYGPERRAYWRNLDHGPRTPADGQEAPLTHRVLRMTQPQPMPDSRNIITVTQGGLTLIGPRRDSETIISPDNATRSYTTPYPLPDGRVLCASTLKTPHRREVDLGLYVFDPSSRTLTLLYNDPAAAEFEARPILPRRRPPVLPASTLPRAYSGRFLCASVFTTREKKVTQRGKLVRLIEGVPVVGRHSTHTNTGPVWTNHGGTHARVLGTAPLLPDGSFYIEAPADRLVHFQVLDSDRRVVGNQLTWIYTRPGEMKSCVGCHEDPHATTQDRLPLAAGIPPLKFLPHGDEFRYRAKAWFKGHLPPEIEERTRTVRAVNLLGR